MAGKRASSLPKKTNQRRNTQAGRKTMSPSNFALPKQKKYRLDDAAHARNALARVQQHGSPGEKAAVRRAISRKYPSIGKTNRRKKGGK